jgi:iron-sulfur cluster assembly protein
MNVQKRHLSRFKQGMSSVRTAERIRCSVATPVPPTLPPAISLSEKALAHIKKMRDQSGKDLTLRVGVRQGGCSGMSYVMDFEERSNIREEDSLIEQDGFTMVCDPKSLLYLFGMQLDYSDALIGGGFNFQNPNASSTCGCGKSFAA